MRRTSQWPVRSGQFIRGELGPRLDESMIIEGDTTIEPASARICPGHDEHMAHILSLCLRTIIAAQVHSLEVILTVERGDFGAGVHRDPRILLNASDQVSRHSLGQTIRSYEHVYVSRRLSEGHGGLASRVAAANDANLFSGAQLRLDERGAVVNPGVFELRNILQRELPIFRTGRDDDGTGEY